MRNTQKHLRRRTRRHANPSAIEPLETRTLLTNSTLIDINQVEANRGSLGRTALNSTQFTEFVGNQTVFAANDGISGSELWKTDGTEQGTSLIKDINPGARGSISFGPRQQLGDRLFFTADDGVHGEELWVTDGTEEGTVLVRDINPGATGSNIRNEFVVHAGELYFLADDGTHGLELWRTDGTETGTQLVADINPGPDGQSIIIVEMLSFGDQLLLSATDGTTGRELWTTDGTEAGTELLRDIRPGSASGFFADMTILGSEVFFGANDGSTGNVLWKTDGTTEGTVQALDDWETVTSSGTSPRDFIELNDVLYFSLESSRSNSELWRTDGTDAGTQRVSDINPTGDSFISFSPEIVGDRFFFVADDGVHGSELWVSDGTEAGTQLVRDIRTGTGTTGRPLTSFIGNLTAFDGRVFFTATGDSGEDLLWVSDGTEAGTNPVSDIAVDTERLSSDILALDDDTLLFIGNDGETGFELWKTDGTESGTEQVKNINTISTDSSFPLLDGSLLVDGDLWFSADDGVHGRELFVTDGTRGGTEFLLDINPDGDSLPNNFTESGGEIFFSATGPSGRELYATDGTAAGTRVVSDINPGDSSSSPIGLTDVNGTLFFGATTGSSGTELWKTDGTAAGTTLVREIAPGDDSGFAPLFGTGTIALGDLLLFRGDDDGAAGAELWVSDGTFAGTFVLQDIRPGGLGSNPDSLTRIGDTVYFRAFAGGDDQLWRTDGTVAGTQLVKTFEDVGGDDRFTVLNDELYFEADDGVSGRELWKSDGTTEGTVLVRDVFPGASNGVIRIGPALNGEVYFVGDDGTHGAELWKTDGTEDGTVLVSDVVEGAADGVRVFNQRIITHDNNVFFVSGTGDLWRSDGTDSGTEFVASAPEGSFVAPEQLTSVGDELLFVLGNFRDEAFGLLPSPGVELFAVGAEIASPTATTTDALVNDGNSDGQVDPGDTIEYTVTFEVGTIGTDTVMFADVVDSNTQLVPGSVSVTQGSITRGNNGGRNIDVTVGTLDAQTQVTITYSVVVNDPLPGGVTTVSTQGTFSGSNFDDLLTDDPDTNADFDATVTMVANAGGDDDEPLINISDGTLVEGDNGEQFIEFIVTRSHNNGSPSIPWSTADDTGIAGEDYTASSGTVTFEDGGSLTQTIQVAVLGDEIVELDERFFVNLGAGNCFFGSDNQAVGTIENDDSATISINNVSRVEGDSGSAGFLFEISISAEVDRAVTFTATTTDGTAVAASADYEAEDQELTLSTPGTNATLSVIIVGDTDVENDETFFVDLLGLNANGRDVTFADDRGIGTIENDDDNDDDDDTPPTDGACDSHSDSGAFLVNGTLFVIGTDGNDVLRTSEGRTNTRVWVNGSRTTWRSEDVTDLVMCGFDGRDVLRRTGGQTTKPALLEGGNGNDRFFGGIGPDTIRGGGGNDNLRGGRGQDYLDGGVGNDRLRGQRGRDVIDGGDGNDTIYGGAGNDILLGATGRDRIFGNGGMDLVIGGEDRDTVDGGAGADIVVAGSTSHSTDDLSDILDEWTNTDRDLEQRIANIQGDNPSADRDNGNAFLNTDTVSDETERENLFGRSGTDWFFATESDRLKDLTGFEELDLL